MDKKEERRLNGSTLYYDPAVSGSNLDPHQLRANSMSSLCKVAIWSGAVPWAGLWGAVEIQQRYSKAKKYVRKKFVTTLWTRGGGKWPRIQKLSEYTGRKESTVFRRGCQRGILYKVKMIFLSYNLTGNEDTWKIQYVILRQGVSPPSPRMFSESWLLKG